jgi:NADH-quinone oxidoreductase subunit H
MFLAEWYDFRDLGNAVGELLSWVDGWAPYWFVWVLAGAIGSLAILLFILPSQLGEIWLERKAIGRIQSRYGPNRVGPFGLLQPIADALKLLQKEAMTPRRGDKWVFWAAPIAIFVPGLLAWAVIPWAPNMVFADLETGVLFVLAISSGTTIAIFMAGWSQNNKYALFGAMRVIAMTVSYELPLVLSVLGVVLFTQTLNLQEIVLWQQEYWTMLILLQPLAFAIFFFCSLAELGRTPADIAEAESELGGGFHTEYSGMKFGLFYAVEIANALLMAAFISTLFLGGWWMFNLDNWVPPWLILAVKIYVVYAVFIWIRGTLPRLRIDQLMAFAWKYMVPLAVANMAMVAVEVALWAEFDWPAEAVLPLSALINAVLAFVLVIGWARFIGYRPENVPTRPRLVKELGVILPPEAAAGKAAGG